MLNDILSNSGIAILVSLCSFWYAFRILVAKDISGVRKGRTKPLRDKQGFIREAGLLFVFFGLVAAAAAVALMYSYLTGTLIVLGGIIVTSVLWKRINDKYE